jgi:hypothetical protein
VAVGLTRRWTSSPRPAISRASSRCASSTGCPVAPQNSRRLSRPETCGRKPGPSDEGPHAREHGRPGAYRVPEHGDAALGRRDEPHEHPQRGRLARTVRAEQTEHPAPLDPERHVAHRPEPVGVPLAQALHGERDAGERGVRHRRAGPSGEGGEAADDQARGHEQRDSPTGRASRDRCRRRARSSPSSGRRGGIARERDRRSSQVLRQRVGLIGGRDDESQPVAGADIADDGGRLTVRPCRRPSGRSTGSGSRAAAAVWPPPPARRRRTGRRASPSPTPQSPGQPRAGAPASPRRRAASDRAAPTRRRPPGPPGRRARARARSAPSRPRRWSRSTRPNRSRTSSNRRCCRRAPRRRAHPGRCRGRAARSPLLVRRRPVRRPAARAR